MRTHLTDLKIKKRHQRIYPNLWRPNSNRDERLCLTPLWSQINHLEWWIKGKRKCREIEKINNTYNQVIASLLKLEVPRGAERIQQSTKFSDKIKRSEF